MITPYYVISSQLSLARNLTVNLSYSNSLKGNNILSYKYNTYLYLPNQVYKYDQIFYKTTFKVIFIECLI